MKFLKIETIIWILMLVFFATTSFLDVQQDERRAERQERCFTQAKDDTTALDICSQISSAADGAVSSARRSTFPTSVLFLGLLALLTVRTYRLESKIKDLKER